LIIFFSITIELFNKALFLSQHRRVYTLMVNLFQILNQFVLLFRKNVIEKSSMIWRVLPLVKINTRISETPVFQILRALGTVTATEFVIRCYSTKMSCKPGFIYF
jgi:hypothetical protein